MDPAAQLRRLVESKTFQHAEALKRLLEYLGRQSLEGQADNLKEYTVGIEAFGKPPDYDPKTDSSVRVQASNLRQKLAEYYRTEGVTDPIIVEVPKGHFKLEFRERESAKPEPRPQVRWRGISLALLAALLVTAAVAVWLGLRAAPSDNWPPELQAIWEPYLKGDRPIMISLGTPLFVRISGTFFRQPALNTWEQARNSEAVRVLERQLEADSATPWYSYTGIGEAMGAFELGRLFTARRREVLLQTSSLLSWEEIARNNLIFVGPPKYNLQTKDLPLAQDFVIQHAQVANLNPLAGEAPSYGDKWAPDSSSLLEGHALITRLPGLHARGEIMILAATSTDGTRAAVEYVTKPEYARRLVEKLRLPSGKLPPYFQVVIRARFKSSVPIEITYVTHHVLVPR